MSPTRATPAATTPSSVGFLNNASNVHFNDSPITVPVRINQNNGMAGLQLLYQKTVPGAYDSPELESRSPCHPETRREIVKNITDWINNINREEDVLWLRGPAGSGKTAIAKTLCQLCHDGRSLGGSFFFLRTVPQLNNARHLITTLAHQLAVAMPEVGKRIDEIVVHNCPILDKKLNLQLQELIVEPVQLGAPAGCRMVIIIDGLDECSGEDKQCEIIQEIGAIFQHAEFPISFIITSRPEPWINDELQSTLSGKLREVALEQVADTDTDIRTYLVSGFADIHSSPKHRRTMSKLLEPWPLAPHITNLVLRASGQFIYAATVLKFVDDPDSQPAHQLQAILATSTVITPCNPLAELDQLYIQIMSTCKDKDRTLSVLGTLLIMLRDDQFFSWVPYQDALDVAECLLGLEADDGYLALRRIHSLVEVSPLSPEDRESTTTYRYRYGGREHSAITFYHKSFSDFLLDKSRSGDYFIDSNSIHHHTAIACVDIMKTFSSQSPSTRIHYTTWGYAILHWTYHFSQSGPPTVEAVTALQNFDLHKHYILAMNLFDEENFDVMKHVFRAPNLAFRVTLKRLSLEFVSSSLTHSFSCPLVLSLLWSKVSFVLTSFNFFTAKVEHTIGHLLSMLSRGLVFNKVYLDDSSSVHVNLQNARKTLDQLGALEEFTKYSISVSLIKLVLWLDKCPQGPRKFIRECKEHALIMSPSLRRRGSRWVATNIDQIIVIIRPSETGKSNFIDTVAGTKNAGERLGPEKLQTQEVCAIGVRNTRIGGTLTLVDTPGFNTIQTDWEILGMIVDWLHITYPNGVKLAGVIYVHKKEKEQQVEVLRQKELVDFQRLVDKRTRQMEPPINFCRINLPSSSDRPIEYDVAEVDRASSCF